MLVCFAVGHRAPKRWNLDFLVVGLWNTLQLQGPALADESRWCVGIMGIRIPRSPSLSSDHGPSSCDSGTHIHGKPPRRYDSYCSTGGSTLLLNIVASDSLAHMCTCVKSRYEQGLWSLMAWT